MLRAGITVLCAAAACQAFHVPVVTTSSWLRSTRKTTACQRPTQQRHRRSRRPPSYLGMTETEGAAAQADGVVAAAQKSDEGEGTSVVDAGAVKPRKRFMPKKRKRNWTPEEQAYLDKMADAPIIYKRVSDEDFYPSVGYESSRPTVDEETTRTYTGESMVSGAGGKEDILMRVVVVGGGEAEGEFIKTMSEKSDGKLVGGIYVLWDPSVSAMSEKLEEVNFVNVHELGSVNTKVPAKVAQHANFLTAHMLVAVKEQPDYPADYIPALKKAALDRGITFVGPALAAEVAKGELATFTKLVQDTRAALQD